MSSINEINFQKSLTTDDEWEETVFRDGLIVVDVFQGWAGPCKSIAKFLWRLKLQINDKKLSFAMAKADTIECLENYRGKCEPCFLIYGGGILVGVVRGANPQKLEYLIKKKLIEEHLAIKGVQERIEIKDEYFMELEQLETEMELNKELEVIQIQVALVIIRPRIVEMEKHLEIVEKIKEMKIIVLNEELRQITEVEIEKLYHNIQNTDFYNTLVKSMTNGPSYFLLLQKGNEEIINTLPSLLGPSPLELAQKEYPESIRALYGKSDLENAVHYSKDRETCLKELLIFYPDFVAPEVKLRKDRKESKQKTIAILRHTALREYKEMLLESIEDNGFKILLQKEFSFNKEEATKFYANNLDNEYLEDLIVEMCEGPFLVLSLSKVDAINNWRVLLGNKDLNYAQKYEPYSLRAKYAFSGIYVNLIHGSDSIAMAEKETKYFFPIEQTIGAIKPDAFDNREEILELIGEFGFKITTMKEVELDKEMVMIMYKKITRKPFFTDLIKYMTSGNCLFIILSKQNAIKEWRYCIGPTDPEMTEDDPDCLRALYGRDILENAIYGSSDAEEVRTMMALIFGDIEINDDGSEIHDEEDKENEEDKLLVEAKYLVDDILSESKNILKGNIAESFESELKNEEDQFIRNDNNIDSKD